MNKLTKIILTFLLLVTVAMGYSIVAMADSKSELKQKEKQLITEMVQEIEDLGATPIKKGFKGRKKYISALKEQLEDIKKAKKKADEKKKAENNKADEKKKAEKKKQALMDDLRKQIIDLDPDAKLVTDDSSDVLDKDKDIIALKKQLEDIINAKKRADEKRKAEKKKADEKRKAEEAKEKEKEKRVAVIVRVKKEIYFLGGTPMAEFEVESEDAYIEALKKQIEELKIQKEAEEKEIAESIPEWYLMPPQGSDVLMYVRGSAVSDQLQLALDLATNSALKSLGKKVETRLASKSQECIRQAGIGEDQVSKTEINLISSTVVDEIIVSGYDPIETKLVSLDNGNYRAFILLKYPVAKAYKSYIEKIDKSPELKGRLTKIKGTDIYKELKKAVARYSGYSGS
mgnify:CR=1 FL=1